jgi:hypothetical protein
MGLIHTYSNTPGCQNLCAANFADSRACTGHGDPDQTAWSPQRCPVLSSNATTADDVFRVSPASLQTSQVAWVTIPFFCRLVLHWILFRHNSHMNNLTLGGAALFQMNMDLCPLSDTTCRTPLLPVAADVRRTREHARDENGKRNLPLSPSLCFRKCNSVPSLDTHTLNTSQDGPWPTCHS